MNAFNDHVGRVCNRVEQYKLGAETLVQNLRNTLIEVLLLPLRESENDGLKQKLEEDTKEYVKSVQNVLEDRTKVVMSVFDLNKHESSWGSPELCISGTDLIARFYVCRDSFKSKGLDGLHDEVTMYVDIGTLTLYVDTCTLTSA